MTERDKKNLILTITSISGVLLFAGFIIGLAFYLSGPKFKAGDCLQDKWVESWQKYDFFYKVLMVGKHQYHLTYTFSSLGGKFNNDPEDNGLIQDESIGYIETEFEKVKCP